MKTLSKLLVTIWLVSVTGFCQAIVTPYVFETIGGTSGVFGYDDATNASAQFGAPWFSFNLSGPGNGVTVDSTGAVYVADTSNHAIRKITSQGTNWVVSFFAGQPGNPGWQDGFANFAQFNFPMGLAVDAFDNIYVADTQNNAIRLITQDGQVSTIGGYPLHTDQFRQLSGGYKNGVGTNALFNTPTGVAVDSFNNVYVSDNINTCIRKLTPNAAGTEWTTTTFAGSDNLGFKNGLGTNALFNYPTGVAVDGMNNVFVVDENNSMIRKITPGGLVSSFAGQPPTANQSSAFYNGIPFGNADGVGPAAQFFLPWGIAADTAGNVFVTDQWNSEIRKITPDGSVTTLGGSPKFIVPNFVPQPAAGYADGSGTAALFNYPAGIAVDNTGLLYIFDAGNGVLRQASAPAIQVVALEVTQVIQDWSNSIPLIQGKDTYVRAHVQLPPINSGALPMMGARLYGFSDAGLTNPLPTPFVLPINNLTVQTMDASDPMIRGYFTNSLNFRLPPEWVTNDSITVKLGWPGGLEATNVVPSNGAVTAKFVPASYPQIKFLTVNWTDSGGTLHDVGPDLTNVLARVLACYPTAKVISGFGSLPWPSADQPDVVKVNRLITSLSWFSWERFINSHSSTSFPLRYHAGFSVTNIEDVDTLGLATGIPSLASSAVVLSGYGMYRQITPHELGHNLGLNHDVSAVLFGTNVMRLSKSAKGACTEVGAFNYVYPLFQPFPGSAELRPTLGPMTNGVNSLIYGLDTYTLNATNLEPVLTPVPSPPGATPNDYFDLMSYCYSGGPEGKWPSSVTYKTLLTNINSIFNNSTNLDVGILGIGNFLVVRGTVDFNAGTGEFIPVLSVASGVPPPGPAPGTNFWITAFDATGAVVQKVLFDLEPSIVEEGDANQTGDFVVPIAADPAIHTLKLYYQGQLLATVTASAHPPVIALAAPNGGETYGGGPINVTWTASDPDGDALSYTIQFSSDGGASWDTLIVDWPQQSVTLNSGELAATRSGLIRVMASDGFNTVSAQSATTFTIQPHAPVVTINAPLAGSTVIGDQQLFLDSSAVDMQDGLLAGTNVVWKSSLDGALGAGSVITFNARNLTEGNHILTVTAVDSFGLTNSATTRVLVLHNPPPQLTMKMVGAGSAILSWPSYYTNYRLQSSTRADSGWTAVAGIFLQTTGYQQMAEVTVSGKSQFFRLFWQP